MIVKTPPTQVAPGSVLDESVCRRYFVDMLEAVCYLHAQNVVHRDIRCLATHHHTRHTLPNTTTHHHTLPHHHTPPHIATHTHTPQHIATHHHTPPHIATHYHTPPHTATHCHTFPHTTTHHHTPPHTTTHHHTPPHTTTHHHTPPHITTHYYTPALPHTTTYHHTSPYTTTHRHTLPHTTTHHHTLPHTASHSHRCDNFLVHANDRIKLCDFSRATHFSNGDALQTVSYSQPPYSSPEILEKKPHNPKTSDIWALGVCLHFLLTSKLPFTAVNDSLTDLSIPASFKTYPTPVKSATSGNTNPAHPPISPSNSVTPTDFPNTSTSNNADPHVAVVALNASLQVGRRGGGDGRRGGDGSKKRKKRERIRKKKKKEKWKSIIKKEKNNVQKNAIAEYFKLFKKIIFNAKIVKWKDYERVFHPEPISPTMQPIKHHPPIQSTKKPTSHPSFQPMNQLCNHLTKELPAYHFTIKPFKSTFDHPHNQLVNQSANHIQTK